MKTGPGSIVIWAGGKLHRVDVASAKVTPIPFRLQTEREVREAIRYPVEVAPKTFDVKMLRWVTVCPYGRNVVYQALGVDVTFFTATFAMSRSVGWLAHFLESRENNRIVRPAAEYVGRLPA